MASASLGQLLYQSSATQSHSHLQQITAILVPCSLPFSFKFKHTCTSLSGHRKPTIISKAAPGTGGTSQLADDDDDGVSLGTMKLPLNIDIPRFESLLFQWANSLCQGSNLPLPVPLKVDKISGGARLGFITIGDESKVDVLVYIDCLVFPSNGDSGPLFRAIRNGKKKDQPPPGEPRIMRSLMQALQKSAEIARV